MKPLLTLAMLAIAACGVESPSAATEVLPVALASALALQDADFTTAAEVPDCALFEKQARRVLSTSPGAFVLRMLYDTQLVDPYWKAVNLATGGLLYRGDFGDIQIRIPAGQHSIGLWVEAETDRLYSCHVGTLDVTVPAAAVPPSQQGGTVSNAHFAASGQEVTFWSGDIDTPSTMTAMVQWSLGPCPSKCATHGTRRLRIRVGGTVVAEATINGPEDIVTHLTVQGDVGPGHVTVTGSHVTTLNGAGVPVWAVLGFVRVE